MKKIKAVIFDLDGTIGDTLPLCIKAFRKSIEPLIGRHVSDAELIATFGSSEEGTIMSLAPLLQHGRRQSRQKNLESLILTSYFIPFLNLYHGSMRTFNFMK